MDSSNAEARLDARLRAALSFIRAGTHADIGSDHARLPIALLRTGRVERCVIVERTAAPLANARAAVTRAAFADRVDLRLGDGFAPLKPGEVDSASLTGMGARTVEGILTRALSVLPGDLIVQPNDAPERLRAWALRHGYDLVDEALAPGFWTYPVLKLRRAAHREPDPAYAALPGGLTLAVAVRWGPHLLRRRDPLLREQLDRELQRLEGAARHGRPSIVRDLMLARQASAWWTQP